MSYRIDRRGLVRSGLGLAAAGVLAGRAGTALAAAPSGAVPRSDAEVYGVPTTSPLVVQRADPFISPPVDGRYYFTGSVPEYDRIVIRGASSIGDLSTATESVIWRRPSSGKMGGHIWAPELHRIDGRWYVYFAAGDSDDVFRIRMYVLESALADPRDPAGWVLRGQIMTPWQSFSLDATTFEHGGERYLVWAQSEPEIAVNTSLYIARMTSPWTITGDPVRIATPTRAWETQGFKVNEGPAVLVRNGRVFMTFSASATDSRYCMGLLTADAAANLLDAAAWTKTPEPVFTTSNETRQYGPGHNSFTVAEDGETDVLVYHARDYEQITGDPLYDPNRHARVQKLYWHPDGTPLFGVPVGVGGPIVRLTPGDAAGSHVRHLDGLVRVDARVRELADSQFRFVPGFAGPGTESIQSVNFPDRYLSVNGSTVRLGPAGSGPAWDAAASFRRSPASSGKGVTIALADGSAYLRHQRGLLIAGSPAGARSTFVTS